MKIWDPDHPGCAPETCGGTNYDPCVTVMRTRGRWHDGSVPATAAEAVKALSVRLNNLTGSDTCACGEGRWRGKIADHEAHEVVAVIADWLRVNGGTARDVDLLDGRDPGPSPTRVAADPAVMVDVFKQPVAIRVSFEPEFEAAILAAAHRLADEAGVPRTMLIGEPTSGDWVRERERAARERADAMAHRPQSINELRAAACTCAVDELSTCPVHS